MGRYLLRRLAYSLLTIAGVMVITFLLFRVVAGDISAAWLGTKSTVQQRSEWRHRHGYDKPLLANLHDHLVIRDLTRGDGPFSLRDQGTGLASSALAMVLTAEPAKSGPPYQQLLSGYVRGLKTQAPITKLTEGRPLAGPPAAAPAPQTQPAQEASAEQPAPSLKPPAMVLRLSDGSELAVDLEGIQTIGQLLDRLNAQPARVQARISGWTPARFFDSQFFQHLWRSISFQSRSLETNKTLVQIIRERGPYSLAISVPGLGMEWLLALVIASFVAYYRGSWLDHVGVLASVIGMCVPFLAFMMYGQWLMFELNPRHAYGVYHRVNLYVPIAILVISGLGGLVRFYRTVILDETNRDYVRTAAAKGVSLPRILFVHVLRNCMLPILTNLVLAIPFLILGNLLLESFFGVPGLGDLMITSIGNRDEPVLNALVFLTALIYTLGILVTDLLYSLMDPRIRLH
jgi:peptide/nickel transport system permease protein